jgi:hypothetical protein
MCGQADVKLDIVMKKEVAFHVLVTTNSMVALSHFVYSFLVPLMMCSKIEAGNFTTMVSSVLLNVDKCVKNYEDYVEK